MGRFYAEYGSVLGNKVGPSFPRNFVIAIRLEDEDLSFRKNP